MYALIFSILLLSTIHLTAIGQGNYSIKHYSTESGLPQNSVRDAAVDKNGFVWLGTENGLVRFDGQRFRIFNLANTPSLVSTDRISYVFCDTLGDIYFNTGIFHTYKVENVNEIKQIGKNSYEYFITTNKGLEDCQRYKRSFLQLQSTVPNGKLLDIDGAMHNRVTKIREGQSYIFFDSVYYMRENALLKAIAPGVNSFVANDTLFHINQHRTIDCYFKEKHVARPFLFSGDILADSLYNNHNAALAIVNAKNASLVRLANNYYRIVRKGDSLQTSLVFKNLILPPYVTFLYDNINNQYFACTISDGFYLLKTCFFRSVTEQLPNASLFANAFSSQVLLPGDSILISRNILFDKNGIQKKGGTYWGFAGVADTNGTYWYNMDADWNKTATSFIEKVNRQLHVVMQIKGGQKTIEFFCKDTVTGTVWCAATNAIYKINQQDKKLENLALPIVAKERVWHISIQSANKMWLGTDNGLYLLDLLSKRLKKIKNSDGKTVRNVLNDPQNGLSWVGTYGQGPCYVRNDSLLSLPLDRDKYLLYAHYFFKDKKGYMWIPSNNGLFQASVTDLLDYTRQATFKIYYQYYSNADGFASNEFNGGYSGPWALRSDGVLSLCSMKGLVWFTPESIAPEQPDSPIYIDQVIINGKDTIVKGPLKLPHNYSQLAVRITTPFFGNIANLRLEYKVGGIDQQWEDVPANHTINLSRLAHGKYLLLVRTLGGFGGKYIYASQAFEILPAWYQSLWFYTGIGLLCILLVMWLTRLRVRALLRRKDELEQQVAERTAELKQSNKIKDTMIGLVLHDLRSPIRFMNTVINHMASNRDKMDENDVKEGVNELKKASTSLNDFTDQFFTWISSQHDHFKVSNSRFGLAEVFYEIKSLYEELLHSRGNSCHITPTQLTCLTDRNILQTIVRNVVDNANKNTVNGAIVIAATQKDSAIFITISDNGRGMEPAMVEAIQQGSLDVNNSQLGYRMIMGMLEKINGSLQIKSEPGKGTEVTVVIPQQSGL